MKPKTFDCIQMKRTAQEKIRAAVAGLDHKAEIEFFRAGAKEIGEGSTLPVLGAVAHAIANATGVWIKDLPITPEKILKAMREKRATEESASV